MLGRLSLLSLSPSRSLSVSISVSMSLSLSLCLLCLWLCRLACKAKLSGALLRPRLVALGWAKLGPCGLCWAHLGPMSSLCWAYVRPMLACVGLGWAYVGPMLAYVGPTLDVLAILGLCWGYVRHFMLKTSCDTFFGRFFLPVKQKPWKKPTFFDIAKMKFSAAKGPKTL